MHRSNDDYIFNATKVTWPYKLVVLLADGLFYIYTETILSTFVNTISLT